MSKVKIIRFHLQCIQQLMLLVCLTYVVSAQAASFDCDKARTKVEKMICAIPELSKLDEELGRTYNEVLKITSDKASLRKQQHGWLKLREIICERGKSSACMKEYYQHRIGALNEMKLIKNEERYTLEMSKDVELCNHMLKLFNEDIKKYGWNGDSHQEEHEEFKRIPWKPARFSFHYGNKILYASVEGALFDFNNDGVKDFVIRHIGSLSNARADSLHILKGEFAMRASELVSSDIWNANNQIELAGWGYNLIPPYGSIVGVRVLEPFIYHGTSYLVMRPLFEDPRSKTGYAVIAKYGGGRFVSRELTGKMTDVCYLHRNRANTLRQHKGGR